ncbi:MAG TPA: folate-binding protein [Chiayiivirga sp.]|nr:folate-binding protein [Chiayiivirga sp.]
MSIKPHSPTTHWHTLPCGGVLSLHGADALSFAQAQFANDITGLRDGQWQWSCWLSAKGRVIALFALLRIDAKSLLLWLPDYPAEDLASRLTRMRFRSNVEIQPLEPGCAAAAMAAPESLGSTAHYAQAEIERSDDGAWQRIVLDLSASQPRSLVLTATANSLTEPDAAFIAQWTGADIAHGLPRLGSQQVEAFTPQMLGLERLAAFSVKKGCYPGQEVVARTHFLGQAKRSLIRLRLQHPLEPGSELQSSDGRAQIIRTVQAHDCLEALAVANTNAEAHWHGKDDQLLATTLPLLDGLARSDSPT